MVQRKTKKKGTRKSAKNRGRLARLPVKTILYTFFLLSLLLLSISILGYFIFLRTVVAAELQEDRAPMLPFEEPISPAAREFDDLPANTGNASRCAIIIDDMGYNKKVGRDLIGLPLNLSFSFLPYAPYTEELEGLAYAQGRTILLHLPLEPQSSKWDAGPGALYLAALENQKAIFLEDLTLVPHATGVNTHMGSLYSENRVAMKSLLTLIAEKKLYYIDSYTSGKSVGMEMAKETGVAWARRDIFLDNVLEVDEICERITEMIALAEKWGRAIGIAHPNEETLEALRQCSPVLHSKVELVGVEKLLIP